MWLLTKFLLLLSFLQCMLFWPTTLYTRQWLAILMVLLLMIFNSKKWFSSTGSVIGLVLLTLFLIADVIILRGIIPSISFTVTYFTGICIFKLKDSFKTDLLDFCSKWFAVVVGISLAGYILWLVIGFKPFSTLEAPDYTNYTTHRNFILFLLPKYTFNITRFSGPFFEPGHLGMISSFILYANRFDFKQKHYLWLVLAAILFSLSLAGYVLLILAYLLYRGIEFKHLIVLSIITSCSYYSITNLWNDGKNPVNELIIGRLQYDDEKGISGNNRNLYNTDLYFAKMIQDGSIIWGLEQSEYHALQEKKAIGGAGITIYLISNGIIGLLLIFLYYLTIALNGVDRKFSFGFLILICFCFLQRAYPFWMAWLIPYISSIYTQKRHPLLN